MGKQLDIEQMRALMECVAQNRIGEFSFSCEDFQVQIKGAPAPAAAACAAAPAVTVAAAAAVPAPQTEAAPQPEPEAVYITSPIVGTFYAASGPDKEPFVQVGQAVREGDTVFIVESMKVMNEVPADKAGIVAEVLLKNGDPVEYGQPVLRLE